MGHMPRVEVVDLLVRVIMVYNNRMRTQDVGVMGDGVGVL